VTLECPQGTFKIVLVPVDSTLVELPIFCWVEFIQSTKSSVSIFSASPPTYVCTSAQKGLCFTLFLLL
jgi:hypothetical protein